jgi:FKBP-type peptidyl-prolyl cis-trans isomerase
MNTQSITPTGIAVALAVVVALGLLFFGPHLFNKTTPVQTAVVATSTNPVSNATTTSMDIQSTPTPNEHVAKINPAVVRADGLEITDVTVGTGKIATPGTHVTVNYVGMLTNGTVFDASANRNQPFDFNLGAGQVIKGWDEGVAGMKEGGKRHLVIPAALGYGNQAKGGVIPANATLIFDVELLKVQ